MLLSLVGFLCSVTLSFSSVDVRFSSTQTGIIFFSHWLLLMYVLIDPFKFVPFYNLLCNKFSEEKKNGESRGMLTIEARKSILCWNIIIYKEGWVNTVSLFTLSVNALFQMHGYVTCLGVLLIIWRLEWYSLNIHLLSIFQW